MHCLSFVLSSMLWEELWLILNMYCMALDVKINISVQDYWTEGDTHIIQSSTSCVGTLYEYMYCKCRILVEDHTFDRDLETLEQNT